MGLATRQNQLTKHETTVGHMAANELDSNADTCCGGVNWKLISLSGESFDVFPYTEKGYKSREVSVGTCATIWRHESGREFVLILNEALWFGSDLERSLINPNQLRHLGCHVQDDPCRDEPFGITTTEGVFISMDMLGTKTIFETRVPSAREIEELPHLTLTSPDPWDPKTVNLRKQVSTTRRERRLPGQLHQSDLVLGAISCSLVDQVADDRIIASVKVNALQSTARHSTMTPETLSRIWAVGLDTAQKTMRVTTQQGVRTAVHPITRRYRVDHLHLHRNRLNTHFYADTMFSKTVSLKGNTCAMVYTDGSYTAVYPISTRKHVGRTLAEFSMDVGIPENLTCDLAGESSGPYTEFMKQVRDLRIKIHWSEKGRSNQNHKAEREIGILKARWRKRMIDRNIPARLWDYGLVYEAEILSRLSRGPDGRTGLEGLTGDTPDISEWMDFAFYDLVWYHDQPHPDLTDDSRKLGRWLGVSHRVGSDLCYWIMTVAGKDISCTTVQHVTQDDHDNPTLLDRIEHFDKLVNERLDDHNFVNTNAEATSPYIEDVEPQIPDGNTRTGIIPHDSEYGNMIEEQRVDADDHADLDKYIGAQLLLDVGGDTITGRVIKRARGADGSRIGRPHNNPLFDSRAYIVEFPDGSVEEYMANVIAENMYSQVDEEGRQFELMKEISEHKYDESAISRIDGFTVNRNGTKIPKKTTRGWFLQVEWKGGTSSWVPLKDIKESNPVELAEYAVANQIEDEPAFKWWVPYVLRRRTRILAKIKKKYWRTTHKFGIEMPHTVDQALEIDRVTGTDLWKKGIEKELSRVKVAWEARDDLTKQDIKDGKDLIGYTEIKCHMIFDVKMDFTRKARLVAGGHMTDAPTSVTYSSVVSRDSVRIAFMLAALNGLDVTACDISNAYLNAPCREKVWFLGGSEAGEDKGKILVITRALYGLKSSGASWRSTMVDTLRNMGFDDTRADPDVWRKARNKADGTPYYELVLVYVDDILVVGHEPNETIRRIGEVYEIKEGSDGPPELYLGAQVYKHSLPDGTSAWGFSSERYIKNAVRTVQDLLSKDDESEYHLKTTANVPFPTSYRPELDFSKELSELKLSRYRQLIGILRWAVELGRLDIYLETAVLSQYLASPREGHLEAVYHIFAFLKSHPKMKIVFDPKSVELDESAFHTPDSKAWHDFYGELAEELPPRMPTPRGKAVDITCFVDANHAGNVVTRRSQTGILIFVQNAPIIWFSKKQNTVESSSFGSEFVALRAARDMIVALRYKLRMFGVPLRGPASVLCDNQAVVKNTSVPESTLSKRHNAINYHAVREACAAGIMRVGKECGDSNLADVFTKVLGRGKRYQLFAQITYSANYGTDGPPRKRQNEETEDANTTQPSDSLSTN